MWKDLLIFYLEKYILVKSSKRYLFKSKIEKNSTFYEVKYREETVELSKTNAVNSLNNIRYNNLRKWILSCAILSHRQKIIFRPHPAPYARHMEIVGQGRLSEIIWLGCVHLYFPLVYHLRTWRKGLLVNLVGISWSSESFNWGDV